MTEIKTDLIKLEEGKPYTPGPDEYVITETHSIADIVRYAVSCADADEVRYFLDEQERAEA